MQPIKQPIKMGQNILNLNPDLWMMVKGDLVSLIGMTLDGETKERKFFPVASSYADCFRLCKMIGNNSVPAKIGSIKGETLQTLFDKELDVDFCILIDGWKDGRPQWRLYLKKQWL